MRLVRAVLGVVARSIRSRLLPSPLPPPGRVTRSLVVICHPNPDSLAREAARRVLRGLSHRGDDVRVIDLDEERFDPRVSGAAPGHRAHLAWADRVIIVHPTWFSGHPARLAGWFEQVWIGGPGSPDRRWPGLLGIDVVTSHGSARWLNRLQAQTGQRLTSRVLRRCGHQRCRVRRSAIYDLDRQGPEGIQRWLEQVEQRYAAPGWCGSRRLPFGPWTGTRHRARG